MGSVHGTLGWVRSRPVRGQLIEQGVTLSWTGSHVYLLPHFLPTGLFFMLHRLGMVMAIAGLIPAFLAKGESTTAQRHLGAVLINAVTLVQQVGGTLALAFPAALKQELKLAAAD